MKKYFTPQMEIELLEGQDLFSPASPGVHGSCDPVGLPCNDCSDDDYDPAPCFNITLSGDEGPGI